MNYRKPVLILIMLVIMAIPTVSAFYILDRAYYQFDTSGATSVRVVGYENYY